MYGLSTFMNCKSITPQVPVDKMVTSAVDSVASYFALGRKATVVTGVSVLGAAKSALGILNTVNPVSLVINYGPTVVATPIRYVSEEIQGFTSHLLNPKKSLVDSVQYFAKKPIRIARLLQALGLPVDPTTMAIFKMESDLDKIEKFAPQMMKGKFDASKMMTTNVERVRGKIILSFIKAFVDGGEDLTEDMLKLLPKLFAHSGERAVARTLMKATS